MANLIDFNGTIDQFCAVQESTTAGSSNRNVILLDVKVTRLIDCDVSFTVQRQLPVTKEEEKTEEDDTGKESMEEDSLKEMKKEDDKEKETSHPTSCPPTMMPRSESAGILEDDKEKETSHSTSCSPTMTPRSESAGVLEDDNEKETSHPTSCPPTMANIEHVLNQWDKYFGSEIKEAHLKDRIVFVEVYFSGSAILQVTMSNCFSTYEMWGQVFDCKKGDNITSYIATEERSRQIMKKNDEVIRLYSATYASIRPEKFVKWVLNNIISGIPMIVSSNMKLLFSRDANVKQFFNYCVSMEPHRDAVCGVGGCGKYPVAQRKTQFLCNYHARNLDSYLDVLLYLPLLVNIKVNRGLTELQCFNFPVQFSARRKIDLPWSSDEMWKWTTVKMAKHPKPILEATRFLKELVLHDSLHNTPKDHIHSSSCFHSWVMYEGGTVSSVERMKCILRRLVFE